MKAHLGQPIESDKDKVLKFQLKISFLKYSTGFSQILFPNDKTIKTCDLIICDFTLL